TDPDVIACAAELGLPSVPGAFTPTEIVTAWRAGASAVKVFPASLGGPDYGRQVRGPLPAVALLPPGGIGLDDIGGGRRAGARRERSESGGAARCLVTLSAVATLIGWSNALRALATRSLTPAPVRRSAATVSGATHAHCRCGIGAEGESSPPATTVVRDVALP